MARLPLGRRRRAPSRVCGPASCDGRMLQLSDLVAAESVRLARGRPDRTYKVEPRRRRRRLRVDAERQAPRAEQAAGGAPGRAGPPRLHQHAPRCSTRCTCTGTRSRSSTRAGRPAPARTPPSSGPDEPVSVEFVADNPGQWMIHCHNNYHQEGGMMLTLSYVTDRPLTSARAGLTPRPGVRLAGAQRRLRRQVQRWLTHPAVSDATTGRRSHRWPRRRGRPAARSGERRQPAEQDQSRKVSWRSISERRRRTPSMKARPPRVGDEVADRVPAEHGAGAVLADAPGPGGVPAVGRLGAGRHAGGHDALPEPGVVAQPPGALERSAAPARRQGR